MVLFLPEVPFLGALEDMFCELLFFIPPTGLAFRESAAVGGFPSFG